MQGNLISLQNINTEIQKVQTALSTGKAVNSASDDAVAFFSAQQGYNQATSLNQLKAAMGEGLQTVSTALNSITSATSILQQMKGLANQALSTSDTTQKGNLQTQYNQLQSQLNEITQNDANYKGTNLLSGQTGNNLTIDFNSTATSSITISSVDTTTTAYQPAAASGWATSDTNITASQTAVTTAIASFNGLSQTLGSYNALIQTRSDFTTQLSNIFQTGADNLTNADINKESADMLALQTQQQLSVSALSLANQANQSVLRLFQ
jgi:flagellin-like hook-associated protein FlgL